MRMPTSSVDMKFRRNHYAEGLAPRRCSTSNEQLSSLSLQDVSPASPLPQQVTSLGTKITDQELVPAASVALLSLSRLPSKDPIVILSLDQTHIPTSLPDRGARLEPHLQWDRPAGTLRSQEACEWGYVYSKGFPGMTVAPSLESPRS